MRITNQKYYEAWKKAFGKDLSKLFNAIDFSDEKVDLAYQIKAAAVYSSNIEGNSVDLNAFMNTLFAKAEFKPRKEIQEIEDLVAAYEFAKTAELTEKNFLKAHRIFSHHLLNKSKRSIYRNDRMGVFGDAGLVYLAIEAEYVAKKMQELFEDIQTLLKSDLSIEALFYHASLLHLVFVHIHPLWDGNGRAARLLEKWFLAQKINSRAWKIPSEKYYKEHISEYYDAINLGVNYYELDYDKCIPFLLLLPKALY